MKKTDSIIKQLQNNVCRNSYHKQLFSIQGNDIVTPYFIITDFSGKLPEEYENSKIDISGFIGNYEKYNYKMTSFPDPDEMKKNITKIAGRKYSTEVKYSNGIYTVNARFFYLINLLLKTENVFFSGPYNPLYIQGEKGNCYLLPINDYNRIPGYSII